MATGSTCVEVIAQAAGFLPATVERTARALKEARIDAWPMGRPGGGRVAPHVEPQHLASLILALAGAQPSDAVPTVSRLFGLRLHQWDEAHEIKPGDRYSGPNVLQSSTKRNQLLRLEGDALGGRIAKLIGDIGGGHTALAEALRRVEWTLILNPTRPIARISWLAPGEIKVHKAEVYGPEQASFLDNTGDLPRTLVSRETTIPFGLIEVAAELWADTLAHRGQLPLSDDAPGGADPDADPENESTASLPGEAAPTRDQSPKKALGNRTYTKPEVKGFSFFPQGEALRETSGREALAGGVPGRTATQKARSHERPRSAPPPHSANAAAA